jgi:hypothetical protein
MGNQDLSCTYVAESGSEDYLGGEDSITRCYKYHVLFVLLPLRIFCLCTDGIQMQTTVEIMHCRCRTGKFI